MSESKSNTSTWLRFFRAANIPSGIDTKYALIFDENRIRMDMLMDLNKEILRDMGIVAIGDIIAILKHSKKVHEETKEQAVESNKPIRSRPPSPSLKCSTVAKQERSAGSIQSITKPAVDESQKETKSSTSGLSTTARAKLLATCGALRVTKNVSQITGQPAPPSTSKKIITLRKIRTSSEIQLKEEVPVQKKIRVLPEQEGRYLIKMPEGTTPRTRKLIESRLGPGRTTNSVFSNSVPDKKTIFTRLGDSKVSSSTEDAHESMLSLGQTSVSKTYVSHNQQKRSVFERLGDQGKQTQPPCSISNVPTLLPQLKGGREQTTSFRSRLDAQTHQEKTLKTIPSRISIPFTMNGARGRTELNSAEILGRNNSTITRIISTKNQPNISPTVKFRMPDF